MAEAAGLALGAISLGLDVCKGILTYADAIRSQTDDLGALERQAKTLKNNLDIVSNILARYTNRLSSSHEKTDTLDHAAYTAVQDSVALCESDLQAVHSFITEHARGCSVDSPKFRDRCRDGYRSLKYGFRTAKRQEVEQRLAHVNCILLVSMQGLGL